MRRSNEKCEEVPETVVDPMRQHVPERFRRVHSPLTDSYVPSGNFTVPISCLLTPLRQRAGPGWVRCASQLAGQQGRAA